MVERQAHMQRVDLAVLQTSRRVVVNEGTDHEDPDSGGDRRCHQPESRSLSLADLTCGFQLLEGLPARWHRDGGEETGSPAGLSTRLRRRSPEGRLGRVAFWPRSRRARGSAGPHRRPRSRLRPYLRASTNVTVTRSRRGPPAPDDRGKTTRHVVEVPAATFLRRRPAWRHRSCRDRSPGRSRGSRPNRERSRPVPP